MPHPSQEDDAALICPSCGYDLRARVDDQCSECGFAFSADDLKVSHIPWARRRDLGRLRGYLKTLWMVTGDDRRLRYEASRPQQRSDAHSFRRITSWILALGFIIAFSAIVRDNMGLAFLAIPQPTMFSPSRLDPWVYELLIPWSAAAVIWGLLPILFIGLAFHLTRAPLRLFHVPHAPPRRQERIDAIACYATAPLTLLLGVIAYGLCIHWLVRHRWLPRDSESAWLAVSAPVALVILVLSLLRVVQWQARVKHRGLESLLLNAPRLLGIWGFAVILWLGILPWCVGFLWIVLDSFL